MGSDPDHPSGAATRDGGRPGVIDWTLSPAKWGAVGVLALAGCMGLAWSVIRGEARLGVQSENPARQSLVEPRPLASLPPADVAATNPRSEPVPSQPGAAPSLANHGSQPQLVASSPSPPPGPSSQSTDSPMPAQDAIHAPATTPTDPPPPVPDSGIAQRVNLNTATEAELQVLPGIGPSRAQAIIEDRRLHGPFRSIDELDRVRGIGPGIIEGLRQFARVR